MPVGGLTSYGVPCRVWTRLSPPRRLAFIYIHWNIIPSSTTPRLHCIVPCPLTAATCVCSCKDIFSLSLPLSANYVSSASWGARPSDVSAVTRSFPCLILLHFELHLPHAITPRYLHIFLPHSPSLLPPPPPRSPPQPPLLSLQSPSLIIHIHPLEQTQPPPPK